MRLLRARFDASGLSYDRFGESVGLSGESIRSVLTGTRAPSKAILRLLGIEKLRLYREIATTDSTRAAEAVVTEEMVNAEGSDQASTGDWHMEAVYEQIEELQQAAKMADSEPIEALYSDAADMALWLLSQLTAALSRAEGQEPAVKPLEWSGEYPEQPGLVAYRIGATNPFGGMGWGYRIDYPSDRSSFHASSSGGFDKKFKTMEAAVAACEAHYQQRATDAIRSALVKAPAPAVPDGWKLVPVEPTEEMLFAAAQKLGYDPALLRHAYTTMLAAAASQPLVRGEK